MANTSSAKKAERVALRRRVINARRRKGMKDAVKSISKLITGKDAKGATAMFAHLQKAVDKAVKGGLIKRNAAARIKSKMAKKIRALA